MINTILQFHSEELVNIVNDITKFPSISDIHFTKLFEELSSLNSSHFVDIDAALSPDDILEHSKSLVESPPVTNPVLDPSNPLELDSPDISQIALPSGDAYDSFSTESSVLQEEASKHIVTKIRHIGIKINEFWTSIPFTQIQHKVDFLVSELKKFFTEKSEKPGTADEIATFTRDTLDKARILSTIYWKKTLSSGFNLALIDKVIVFCTLLRFIIFSTRYNPITSVALTATSGVAAYLWYLNFLNIIGIYDDFLYDNIWTFSLGVDAVQMRTMLEGQVATGDYNLRITNPLGIILHSIQLGSVVDGYRIDPISMLITKIPEKCPEKIKHYIEGGYYYLYNEVIPFAFRTFTGFVEQFRTYSLYTYVTRVNRRYCPYLIRWHWTFVMLLNFISPFLIHIVFRMFNYQEAVVIPQIEIAQSLNIVLPGRMFELQLLYTMAYTIIIGHLSFVLWAMFHALWGQYFYFPFMTENVELHVGLRDKFSIYSGGGTAWQDTKEQLRGPIPKLWYGWFGRGTKTTPLIFVAIRRIFFDPIYNFIRIILAILRNIFWRK